MNAASFLKIAEHDLQEFADIAVVVVVVVVAAVVGVDGIVKVPVDTLVQPVGCECSRLHGANGPVGPD